MKRLVLILRKVAKFVFRLISSRLSSRGAAGTINPGGLLANYSKRNLLANYSKTPLVDLLKAILQQEEENTKGPSNGPTPAIVVIVLICFLSVEADLLIAFCALFIWSVVAGEDAEE